jgi:hypothetical protein
MGPCLLLVAAIGAVGFDDGLLIYNRMPKCGSSTIQSLLRKLATNNHFTFEDLPTKFTLASPPAAIVLRVSFHLDPDGCVTPQTSRRTVVVGHFPYVHASQLWNATSARCRGFRAGRSKLGTPVYINLVRDPIDRFVSETNYLWFGPRPLVKMQLARAKARAHGVGGPLSVDALVRAVPDCSSANSPYVNEMTRYFCGHAAECTNLTSEGALAMAKMHARESYVAVGVLERLTDSLRLFEAAVPSLLAGLYDAYAQQTVKRQRVTTNVGGNAAEGRGASDVTRAFLRRCFDNDYRLYEYLKELFEQRLLEYGLAAAGQEFS